MPMDTNGPQFDGSVVNSMFQFDRFFRFDPFYVLTCYGAAALAALESGVFADSRLRLGDGKP